MPPPETTSADNPFDDVIGVLVLPGCMVIRLASGVPADKVKPVVLGGGRCEKLRSTHRWMSVDPLRQETALVMEVDLQDLLLRPDLRIQVWVQGYLAWDRSFPDSALPTLVGRIEAVRDYCLTGWAADLRGEAVPPLELLIDGEAVADAAIAITRHDLNRYVLPPSCVGFRIPLPARVLDGATHDIRVRVGDETTFALAWQARPRFEVEAGRDGAVSLWFFDAAMPDAPVTISLCRDGTVLHSGPTRPYAETMVLAGRSQTGFTAALPPPAAAGIELCAGRDAQLAFASLQPRTPATVARAFRRIAAELLRAERTLGLDTGWSRDRLTGLRAGAELERTVRPGLQVVTHRPPGGVSVLVPVYKGVADTRACLESLAEAVRAGTSGIAEIILVDDASPEPAMAELLREQAGRGLYRRLGVAVQVLRNPGNLGFVASVNAGIAVAMPRNDILLLNSDTVVPVGFAARLQAAAYSRPDIASVTPLSNDATILSLPDRTGGNPLGVELVAVLDDFLQARDGDRVLDIPVGVGFCILLRRDALADVGGFGAEWGRGYCEEVDWCLRARDRGWTHAAALDTFVHHRGSVSFGSDERSRILARNHALLEQRYPEYVGDLKATMADDPLQAVRREAFCLLLRRTGQPCLVHFTHKMGGGTSKLLEALAGRFAASGGVNLVCSRVTDDWLGAPGYEVHWRERNLTLRLHPAAITGFVLDLEKLGLPGAALVVHSLTGVGPDIYAVTAATTLPCAVYVHDFQWYCPRVVLVDQTRQYCGEPGAQYCQLCVRANPIYDFAEDDALIHADLPRWIARNALLLERARLVVVPSRDTATRIAAHFPRLALRCVPHPESVECGLISRMPDADRWTRIAVVGGISVQKGSEVLRSLALHIEATGAPVSIEVIGTVQDPSLFAAIAAVTIGGTYRPEELAGRLARFDPHIVFFPAVWPETYSFVLSEVWAAGYPVVAFDIGAIAERIRATGAGVVLPFETGPATLLARLLDARRQVADLAGLEFAIGHTGSFADDPVAELFRAEGAPCCDAYQ